MLVHRPWAGVVRGERKFFVVGIAVQQLPQIRDPGANILARAEGVRHAELPDRRRHQLHQPHRALRRRGHRVEARFDLDDRAHEVGPHAVLARVFLNQVVVLPGAIGGDEPGCLADGVRCRHGRTGFERVRRASEARLVRSHEIVR